MFWVISWPKIILQCAFGPTYAALSAWTFHVIWFIAKKWLFHIKILDFVENGTLLNIYRVNHVFSHILEKIILQHALWAYMCPGEQDSICRPKKHTVGYFLAEIWTKMWLTLFGHFRMCGIFNKIQDFDVKESLFGCKS